MIRFSINIFNRQLRVQISKRRGVGTPLFPDTETLKSFRAGNKASRVARHVLENINLKALLGGNLVALVMVTGVLSPAAASLGQTEPEINTLTVSDQPITTEVAIQYPVDPAIVNQGYHYFHWGIDLDGITGDPVRPIMKGRVVRREFSRWGYGNAVLIDHENGVQSFYAHLSKIHTQEGDEVDTRTVIGEIGSTGRSTGDHLHLELYKNGRPVNPRSVLGY